MHLCKYVFMCLTLIVQRVNGVVYDAVGAEALSFGQQAEQGGDLQPHGVICLLGDDNEQSRAT